MVEGGDGATAGSLGAVAGASVGSGARRWARRSESHGPPVRQKCTQERLPRWESLPPRSVLRPPLPHGSVRRRLRQPCFRERPPAGMRHYPSRTADELHLVRPSRDRICTVRKIKRPPHFRSGNKGIYSWELPLNAIGIACWENPDLTTARAFLRQGGPRHRRLAAFSWTRGRFHAILEAPGGRAWSSSLPWHQQLAFARNRFGNALGFG